MRRHIMPEMKEGGVNVTPLIDIVMCLIIFFMLVAKIGVSDGSDKSINIPVSKLGKDLKDKGNMLTLNVRQVGDPPQPFITALVEGARNGQPIEVKLTEGNRHPLFEILRKLRKGNDKFGVIIRADADIGYGTLVPILTTCSKADVKNFNLNTAIAQQRTSP